jgi:hydroxyacylglutathione hydrolase
MDVSIIETSALGDRSYLVSADGTGVVIDPQRDIDRILSLAERLGVRITHVLETHIHNDYVTGGLELSRHTGAEYVVPGGEEVDYSRRAVSDGDVVDAGPIRLQAISTPGHTHHHISYTLSAADGVPVGVFSGGSMLFGTTGRTDLLGAEHIPNLSRAQYHSVRRLAGELPEGAQVYPTHGFGSFCAATPASGDESTIGEQREVNPALTQDEQTYVEGLIAGLTAYPAYYAHMGVINRHGPAPVDLSLPTAVDPDELRRRIDAGEWIVDLRHRTAFAAGHLYGSVGFELSDSFVTYLGWLYPWDTPLTFIGDDDDQIADAQRELVRIGIENVTGAAVGPITALSTGGGLRSYRVANFSDLAEVSGIGEGTVVLDVRQSHEYDGGHLVGALNIPVNQLVERIDELPAAELWVHCATGYRASVAASILDRAGRQVVLIDDDFENAAHLTGLDRDH